MKNKMSLENMQGKLSRSEMKKIMAGTRPDVGCNCNPVSVPCPVGQHCQLHICTATGGLNGFCIPN